MNIMLDYNNIYYTRFESAYRNENVKNEIELFKF